MILSTSAPERLETTANDTGRENFERLGSLEQSSVLFRVQNRSYERIGNMIFTLFYGGELTNAPITSLAARPLARDLARLFPRSLRLRPLLPEC